MTQTLLLVDDNEELARFTALMLERSLCSLNVVIAHNCADARRLNQRIRPRVLVVDRDLPDGDGLHLQHELQATTGDQASILITADCPPRCRDLERQRHFVRALSKPFDFDDLVEAIQRALALVDQFPTRAAAIEATVRSTERDLNQ